MSPQDPVGTHDVAIVGAVVDGGWQSSRKPSVVSPKSDGRVVNDENGQCEQSSEATDAT